MAPCNVIIGGDSKEEAGIAHLNRGSQKKLKERRWDVADAKVQPFKSRV